MKIKLGVLLFFMVLGKPSVAQNIEGIKTELERDYNTSLALRRKIISTIKNFGYKSEQMDSLNTAIVKSDSIASVRTISIIEKYGWLGKSKIGFVANQALFLIIQHANKTSREKYYPLLEASAKRGESNLFDMAAMKDRILVESGHQQVYGTQRNLEGNYYPIMDIKGLNKRRKQVGLGRLKIRGNDLKLLKN